MKAFRVSYGTGDKDTSMVVLCEEISNIEQAIANKDNDFTIGDGWSIIYDKEEIPLSNVLVSELSITELLDFLKNNH